MKAVLDACVLYPTVLREILLSAAGAGLYQPLWSARLLDEWRRAAARLGTDQDGIAGAEIALLRTRWPAAEIAVDGDGVDAETAGIDWPDPADRHVVDTALAAGADTIVTANLRDFPRRPLAALGIRAVHPDAFLCDLHGRDRRAVADAVCAAHRRAQAAGGPTDLRALLKRARLTRLAKLVQRC